MTTYGYVRVSSVDQNEARQVATMRELGVEKANVYIDKASGKDTNRPQYQALRSVIQAGDLIYMDDLDRLGRSYDNVIDEWKYITRKVGADIAITSTPSYSIADASSRWVTSVSCWRTNSSLCLRM